MRSKSNGTIQRTQNKDRIKGDGLNWIIIAGGALLSTLSFRIGCKLKQALEAKRADEDSRGNDITAEHRLEVCHLHSNLHQFTPGNDRCYYCLSGHANSGSQFKQATDIPILKESEISLPLIKISATELSKDTNGNMMWACSSELLDLPHKPFHHSNCSDSPSISESGSDIYTKREVIIKLRQQLRNRDEMIMAMQNQIADLQTSLSAQISRTAQTQSQLDSANHELFESERDIQRLRKVIANHCILKTNCSERPNYVANWQLETVNGFPNDPDMKLQCVGLQKEKGDEEKVVLLKKELSKLKEVIEGNDFLLQSYKEQETEICSVIKALEQRLESSHLHNFL